MPVLDSSTIPQELIIPRVETDIFMGHEDARFAVGILAVNSEALAGREREFHGYLRLRANVYALQKHMIPDDHVREDGTEIDIDDGRSVHYGVVENIGGNAGRIVASMRLIIKSENNPAPLPIETFFPEVFDGKPSPYGSTEASRYICRHPDPVVENSLTWPVFSGALSYIIQHGITPTYGVIEPFLEKRFKRRQVPFKRIAEPRFVDEYAAENLGVEIDTEKLAELVNDVTSGAIDKLRTTEGDLVYLHEVDFNRPRIFDRKSKVA